MTRFVLTVRDIAFFIYLTRFQQFSGCKIIFFDAGTYLVSDTLEIPAGVHIFGETWAVIAGTGGKFNDINNPKPVIQVGAPNSKGDAEIGGIIFSTRGPSVFIALIVS